MYDAIVTLSRTQQATWWSIKVPDDQDIALPDDCQGQGIDCTRLAAASGVSYQNGLCLVVQSQPSVPNIGAAVGVEEYGVTALYVFILVTVGSAVRGALLGSIGDLIYSEMPEPQDLLDLCESIYIVRLQAYAGHLRDEVRLYETLIKLYRSPQMLMRITGADGLNMPPKRGD
jgi:hypothetical protein